jgi:hypothetical protein
MTNIRIFGRYRIHPQGVSSTPVSSSYFIYLVDFHILINQNEY